jgi:hypothetical protein
MHIPFVTKRFYEKFHVVLLSDICVICKHLPLAISGEYKVTDVLKLETVVDVEDVGKSVFSLSFLAETDKYVITAKNPEEKDEWREAILGQLKLLASDDAAHEERRRRRRRVPKVRAVAAPVLEEDDGLF